MDVFLLIELFAQILSKVKNFIDEFLNPHKPNFKSNMSITEILKELEISEENYYEALSVSPDEDFRIHLKRPPNSCFVNNYNKVCLGAWEANIDIQPVFNYYKAVSYMCSYFSKSETESSLAMKKALEESCDLDFKDRMKKVAIAFLSHRQCSVQEAVYQLMPELWLRKTFPVVTFANTNLPDKRYKMCKSAKELEELPDDSVEVFKKNNLDRYMERPNASFKKGKYAVLDEFCYAEFLSYYYLDTKPLPAATNDCQPEVLDDDDSDKPLQYPKIIPLMSSKERMCCRNVKKVLRYHTPNPAVNAEAYAHHLLILFYPFRKESDLLCEDNLTYISKLNNEEVTVTVNRNKMIFEPWGELVESSLRQFSFRPRTDQFADQENYFVENEVTQNNENENDLENTVVDFEIETQPARASIPTPAIYIMTDNEINSSIRSLNDKQREVFNSVNCWARKTVMNYSVEHAIELMPLQLFITGGAGTGKSHLIKTIDASLNKTLNYKSQNLDTPKVLKMAPTGVAASNIDGSTIHSSLGIPVNCQAMQIPKLSNKRRSELRLKYEDLKVIIIDEISMVSNKLLLHMHQRLLDIFGYANNCDKPFAGLTIIVVGDFYQLPPVLQRPVFADYYDEIFNIYHLWKVFKMCELTEVMRQRGDTRLINLLNNVRVGKLTESDKDLLKSRFIESGSELYPHNVVHIYSENEPARLHNISMLEKVDKESFELNAIDQVPDRVPQHVYDRILGQRQSQTSGLAFKLVIKVGAKVMLTYNIDTSDKLTNGQIGTIVHIEYVYNMQIDNVKTVKTVYVKFDKPNIGLNKSLGDNIAAQYDGVPIQKITVDIRTNIKKEAAPIIKRTQFPLALSWGCTTHKEQGLSLEKVVVSFDLLKQRKFNPGQMYVALSRVTSLEGLFLIGTFKESAIVVDQRVIAEYERLRNECLFKDNVNSYSDEEFSIALCNVRSLQKHLPDIAADNRFLKSDLILCTETQISKDEIADIKFDYFDVIENNAEHKFSSLALYGKQGIKLEEEFRLDGVLLVKISSEKFNFKVLLCYRKSDWVIREFYELVQYLSVSRRPDLILGDFNMKPNKEFDDLLQNYRQKVLEPTHIAGSTLDHVYIFSEFSKEITINVSVCNIFFSDHEMIKVRMKPCVCI